MSIKSIHHIQLAMPVGQEPEARRFFTLLGFREVAKPEPLAARGGIWFEAGTVKLHLGVEADFRPARKAHPAFEIADLEKLRVALRDAGIETRPDGDLPGYRRMYVDDPFGNRIELLQVDAQSCG